MASLAVRLLFFLSSYAVIKKFLNVGKVLSIDRRLRHLSQSLSKKPVDLMLSYAHRMSWESSMVSLPLDAKSWPSSSWSNKVSMGVGGDQGAFILFSLSVWSASSIFP